MELPCDLVIPLLSFFFFSPLEKTLTQKDASTLMSIAALFITAQTWKQPKCPSAGEWVKMCCTHIQTYMHRYTHTMEYCSAIKKNAIRLLAPTYMDLDLVTLSEISQTGKDEYVIPLACGI